MRIFSKLQETWQGRLAEEAILKINIPAERIMNNHFEIPGFLYRNPQGCHRRDNFYPYEPGNPKPINNR